VQGPADRRRADAAPAPRRNRAIIVAGLLLCIAGAVAVAYLLGWLDRIGLLS
jgi:ferric-dicitrate binding protein FerR (iron transport regulator)